MSSVILVVEDDEFSRNALCVMLESLGLQPLSFASGKEALAGIEGKKIDIAMLDIMMPEMNGYEVMEELKKRPEFDDVPMIMVTAKDQDKEILTGYKTGVDYYITKPFTFKQIEYGLRLFLEAGDEEPETNAE